MMREMQFDDSLHGDVLAGRVPTIDTVFRFMLYLQVPLPPPASPPSPWKCPPPPAPWKCPPPPAPWKCPPPSLYRL